MPNSTNDLIPLYTVLRNGEPVFITASISVAYPERIATDIKLHLEAVSDDSYSLALVQWAEKTPMPPKSYTDTWGVADE